MEKRDASRPGIGIDKDMGPYEDGVWLLDPLTINGGTVDRAPAPANRPSGIARAFAVFAILSGLAFSMGVILWGPRIAGAVALAVLEDRPRLTVSRDTFRDRDGTTHNLVSFSGSIPHTGIDGIIGDLSRANLKRGDVLMLSSPGGSLVNSLKLGRAIRRMGLNTIVAEKSEGKGFRKTDCASACVFLFAAGVNRIVPPGSKLGVHQFFNRGGTGDVGAAQVASAAIMTYVAEMGVSPDFFARMVMTRGISWLTPTECVTLKLVTA